MIIVLLSLCICVLLWDLYQIKRSVSFASGLKTITPLATEIVDGILLSRRLSDRKTAVGASLLEAEETLIQEPTLNEAVLLLSSRWGGVPVNIFLKNGVSGISHSRFAPFHDVVRQTFTPFFQSGEKRVFFNGSIEDKLSWGGIVSMGYKFGAAERIGDIGVLCMFAETETRIPDGFSRTAQTLEKDLGVLEKLRKLSQAVSDLKRETTFAKDLVQNVSHDLRSPLHTLRLVLSSLGEGEIVEAGVRSCDVAQSVVESLLDLTRDEMNTEEVRSELVSLAEVVREVIPMFRPITALKGVKLESGDFSEFYVVADKRHLKRIITNIISNSVKYTDKGFIRVSVVETEGFGQVIVEDSGCGMSKDELALLGEKGARFARDKAEGLGVGVYGTKQLVAKNGGTLEYSSDKGIGTTATLSFNIAEITKVQSA